MKSTHSYQSATIGAHAEPQSARTRTLAAGLLGALALAGCASAGASPDDSQGWDVETGQAEQPIVGAETDTQHTAVLAVTSVLRRTQALCTGTLIAPNLVLTAQHCVAETDELVNCQSSEFGAAYSADNIYVSPDTTLNRFADFYPVRDVEVPPGNGDVCGRDIALIILNGQFSNTIQPMAPRLDSPVAAGELYTAVGFGDALDEGDPGVRRFRDGLEVACGPAQCRQPSALTSTEFIGDKSVCEGDSGGPALDDAGNILGVVSRGEENCGSTIYSAVAPWRDWILSVTARAIELGNYTPPSWYSALESGDPIPANGTPSNGSGVASNAGDGVSATDDPGLPGVSDANPVRASHDSGCALSAPVGGGAPWSAAALGLLSASLVLRARRRRA
jgi:trypsin